MFAYFYFYFTRPEEFASEKQLITKFLNDLPEQLDKIFLNNSPIYERLNKGFNEGNFYQYLSLKDKKNIKADNNQKSLNTLILESYDEIKKLLYVNKNDNKYYINKSIKNNMNSALFNLKIKNAGLSGNNLVLKSNIIDNLFKNIEELMKDISDKFFIKLNELLDYLSLFLSSLTKAIPGLEQLVEFIKIITSIISIK